MLDPSHVAATIYNVIKDPVLEFAISSTIAIYATIKGNTPTPPIIGLRLLKNDNCYTALSNNNCLSYHYWQRWNAGNLWITTHCLRFHQPERLEKWQRKREEPDLLYLTPRLELRLRR